MDLQLLYKIVESQDTSIGNLADLVGMSKSNLYRCIREKSIKARRSLRGKCSDFFPTHPPRGARDCRRQSSYRQQFYPQLQQEPHPCGQQYDSQAPRSHPILGAAA